MILAFPDMLLERATVRALGALFCCLPSRIRRLIFIAEVNDRRTRPSSVLRHQTTDTPANAQTMDITIR